LAVKERVESAIVRFRLFILILLTCGNAVLGESLTVSAAISLKDAISEITDNFDHQTGSTIALNFGASGQLAVQIAQGAPVDVFLSAGVREVRQLEKQNLADPAAETIVCRNELVLIVPADSALIPKSFSDLTDPRYLHISLGEPATVPAGRYAMEILKHLNIADSLASRLVYGQNVRQVLTYVTRREVEAGIVYSTDAIQAGNAVRVAARGDASMHEPIIYPAALIRGSAHPELAKRYLNYLGSESAKRVLSRFGFLVDRPATRPTP
jgi:molybdate transport system substrate-binding protein